MRIGRTRMAKNNKKHTLRNVIIILLIAALLIGGGVTIFMKSRIMSNSEAELEDEWDTPEYLKSKQLNILVCGIDWDENRTNKLTDVIILCNIDLEQGKINMMQIPRDTYVGDIVYTGKINALYNWGIDDEEGNPTGVVGIKALASVIHEQLQIPIDNYVMITMEGFRTAVDTLGGVEVTIDEPIQFAEDNIMEPGTYTLDGVQADLFVRFRGYDDADVGRMSTQRRFLAGLAKKLQETSSVELISLARNLYQYLETDLSVDEMISLANSVKGISMENMTMLRVPGEGVRGYGKMRLDVFSVHANEFAELLNQYMRPYSDPVPVTELGLIEIQHTSEEWDDPDVDTLGSYD